MPKFPPRSAAARRAAHRDQLVAALVLVCRKVRRLQTSAEARGACDDVARGLRALAASRKHRQTGKR